MSLPQSNKILREFFGSRNFEYCLAGGHALSFYGYTRATIDSDFVTKNSYRPDLSEYLESLGFETLHSSVGFSNHLHSIKKIRIDLIYTDEKTFSILLSDSHKTDIDPERKFREFADLKALIDTGSITSLKLKSLLKGYGLEELFDEFSGN
ncbi:MAG: hypothetical protein ACLFQK_06935 [Fibrobacterota bacterium]